MNPKRKDGSGAISRGYILIQNNHIRRFEHNLIIENVLGKPFRLPHTGHHVDGIRSNNINSNLVACENNGYHHLLHRRQRAFMACGHANWRKCPYCFQYDDPVNMKKAGSAYRHGECKKLYERQKGGEKWKLMD